MNTDHKRGQKFQIFKCEQHSTQRHNLKTGSMVITSSAIGSKFSFSATSVTCDILSFKISYLISTLEDMGFKSWKEQENCHFSKTFK